MVQSTFDQLTGFAEAIRSKKRHERIETKRRKLQTARDQEKLMQYLERMPVKRPPIEDAHQFIKDQIVSKARRPALSVRQLDEESAMKQRMPMLSF